MTRKCCVPGCNSNYKSAKENIKSTFSFPNSELRQQWIRKIPRKDWTPTKFSYVCIDHFDESQVQRVQTFRNKDNNIVEVPLRYPKLINGAVPHIFQNTPAYLSTPAILPRSDPEQRRKELAERYDEEVNQFLNNDMICSFEDLIQNYTQKCCVSKWNSILRSKPEDALLFYLLNVDYDGDNVSSHDQYLHVLVTVIISNQLKVTVFKEQSEISAADWCTIKCRRL